MKRFLLTTGLLLLACQLIPNSVRAATVTGKLLLITGSTTDKRVTFTPDDTPRTTDQGTVIWTPTSVMSSAGVFSVTLTQGSYRVSIDGMNFARICVPAGSGTYSMHSAAGELNCQTGTAIWLSSTILTNTLPGYLSEWSALDPDTFSTTTAPILTNAAANKVVITDPNTNLTTSATTELELTYLAGVTNAIQTQLNTLGDQIEAKQAASTNLDWFVGMAAGTNGQVMAWSGDAVTWTTLTPTAATVTVNDASAGTSVNFADGSPAAPANGVNVKWQLLSGSVSAYIDSLPPTNTVSSIHADLLDVDVWETAEVHLSGATNVYTDDGSQLLRNGSPVGNINTNAVHEFATNQAQANAVATFLALAETNTLAAGIHTGATNAAQANATATFMPLSGTNAFAAGITAAATNLSQANATATFLPLASTNGVIATATNSAKTYADTTFAPLASPALTGTPTVNAASLVGQLSNKVDVTATAAQTMAGALLLPDGTATAPSIGWSSDVDGSGTGLYRDNSNQIGFTMNGVRKLSFTATSTYFLDNDFKLFLGASYDTVITRDAANTLAQRNGTAAQQANIYDTYTDASNRRYAGIGWQKNANALTIETETLGTALGTGGSIILAPLGVTALTVATNKSVILAGTTNQVVFGATNTAPVSSAAPTKWISVQVSGESTVYRLPLYE